MAKTYNRLEIDVNKKPNSIGIRPVQHDTKSDIWMYACMKTVCQSI